MQKLGVYLLAYAALLAYGLLILRLVVRRDYRRRGRLSVVSAMLQALIFFLYGGFPTIYLAKDWPVVHVNPWLHAIGLIGIVAGLGFLLMGMLKLGMLRSLGRGRAGLQRTGLYRRTRNPQALACGLYVIGFAILWPSWYAAGWALMYPGLIHTMILVEEEHLRRTHGEAYEAYCREVPRYLALRVSHVETDDEDG